MSTIKQTLLSLNENKVWTEVLKKCKIYDFYHTHAYQLLEQEGEAKLLVLESKDNLLAFPLVIRKIENTDYNDVSSVYGYAGPVQSSRLGSEKKIFQKKLLSFFYENNIISAFSRLHPLISYQKEFFDEFGEVLSLNRTVFIDLKESLDIQRANYSKSTKRHINRAKKSGINIRISDKLEDLNEFIIIYNENMERVNAKSNYYFSNNYFESLLCNQNFKSFLFLAEKDDYLMAGALITICNGIMQYHLGATRTEALSHTPMKLIFDRARIYGVENGFKFFHLGGGLGGVDDSLFQFKSGFSNKYLTYNVWRHIINPDAYNQLVNERFGAIKPETNYFPLYRYDNLS